MRIWQISLEGKQQSSLDSVFFAECLPILSDHTDFFPTEASVLDRHAEEHVFVVW
jgi:hypothetical protein